MADSTNVWGAVISGLVSMYGQKKKKDAEKDQYKYEQSELERQRQYANEMYQRKQNSPQAKMSRYLLEYYMPQYVEKMKGRNKGGDNTILDKMLADIMGGFNSSGQGSSGGYGGPNSFLALPGVRRV